MADTTEGVVKNYLIIQVVAKKQHLFSSYDLFQAISATGMQFGAGNFFHYYSHLGIDKKPLFSLAAMTESGEFNLNRMGDFTCRGLCLFMDLRKVEDREEALSLMVETAEQLAEDLHGELRAADKERWDVAVREEN